MKTKKLRIRLRVKHSCQMLARQYYWDGDLFENATLLIRFGQSIHVYVCVNRQWERVLCVWITFIRVFGTPILYAYFVVHLCFARCRSDSCHHWRLFWTKEIYKRDKGNKEYFISSSKTKNWKEISLERKVFALKLFSVISVLFENREKALIYLGNESRVYGKGFFLQDKARWSYEKPTDSQTCIYNVWFSIRQEEWLLKAIWACGIFDGSRHWNSFQYIR